MKKNVKGQRNRAVSPTGELKVYGGKDLPKSQVWSSEWKTERVRKDDSGDDSEDGEDNELPCVIVLHGREILMPLLLLSSSSSSSSSSS